MRDAIDPEAAALAGGPPGPWALPGAKEPRMADPLILFAASFGLASCAGLAALLRSGRPPTALQVASAMLNGGLLGLGLALLWYERFRDNLYALVGMTVLAGMGGASFLDLALALARNLVVRALDARDDPPPGRPGDGPPRGAGRKGGAPR